MLGTEKAINNTTVEVTFADAVTDVAALNFAIEGLTITNKVVKQTDAKTVVLTTAAQTAGKEYTVTVNGASVGKFTGISAVIPTAISLVERSQQGVLGQEVTVKAQVTVAEGQSKAGIPVTFNVTGTGSLNTPQLVEATTDANGVATYTYTRYANTSDDVVAYATGDRTKFQAGKVYWAAAKQLTIKDVTEKTTITNGANKVYEINSANFKGGYVFVAFQGNLNVAPDKVAKGVTVEGNTVHTVGTNGVLGQLNASGTPVGLASNKYPYLSTLGNQQVIAVKLDANGKANLVLTGANASAVPVVYEGTLTNAPSNVTASLSNLSHYNASYNPLAVQAVGSEVKFERAVNYGLTLKAEGVQNAAISNSNGTGGRDYVVSYTKEDGKPVAAGSTVYVAIPTVGLSSGSSFVLLDENEEPVNASANSTSAYRVYSLTTDKDGKATFTVTNNTKEDYVQPIVFINDSKSTTSFFDSNDTQATDAVTYFTDEVTYSAGLRLLNDSSKKQESFSVSREAANFTYSLVDQNGKVRKANKSTQVTFNVTTGEGAVTVDGTTVDAHATKQITKTLSAGQSSINVRVVASSPTSVSVYATSSQSGETFLPTETLTAAFTAYASVTGITGYTNASLLNTTNKTFDLVTADGKVYRYSYDATNIRQNNSTVDVATFEAEISKGARVTVAKDAAGNIYYNIVATGAAVPTQATINTLIANGATTIDAAAITAAGGTVPTAADDVTINYTGTEDLSINLDANLTVNAENAENISIAGSYDNLTVNAPKAHVTNTATVTGTTTIEDVATGSFVNNGTLGKVVIKDTNGTKFENKNTVGTVSVDTAGSVVLAGTITNVEVTKAANLNVAKDAEITNLTVKADNVTISGEGTIGEVKVDEGVKQPETNAPAGVSKIEFTDQDTNEKEISGEIKFTASTSSNIETYLVSVGGKEYQVAASGVLKVNLADNTPYASEVSVVAVDKFGKKSEAVKLTVVDNANALAENFNTNDSTDYKGYTVGWNIGSLNLSDLTKMEVSVLAQDGTVLGTNTSTDYVFGLNTKQFSTPFVVEEKTYETDTDVYWNFGTFNTTKVPAKAVITLTDKNGVTYKIENNNLTGASLTAELTE